MATKAQMSQIGRQRALARATSGSPGSVQPGHMPEGPSPTIGTTPRVTPTPPPTENVGDYLYRVEGQTNTRWFGHQPHAERRLGSLTDAWKSGGREGKRPELIAKPRGSFKRPRTITGLTPPPTVNV